MLERETEVYRLPRAVHFDGEVMRVFQAIGVREAIEPHTAPILGMEFVDATGERLFGYESPPGVSPDGWPADYMFLQPEIEHALRAKLAEHPTVELRLGVDVLDVEDRGDDVLVRTDAGDVTAAFVVGCDGARSLVRRAIGSGLFDYGFDQPWLVIDAVMQRDVALSEWAVQYCDPARPATFIPNAGRHRRWEIMLLPGEDPAEVEARSWELLAKWIKPGDAELVRTAVYSFHALVADRWRAGRLVLAGDSAHQMPPFLGQGMCSGIRDAHNLAWKLDRVVRGQSSADLLDTYQPERDPHVRLIIETAIAAGAIIQALDPDVCAERDAYFRSGDATPPEPVNPPIGPGLADEGCERLPQPARLDDRLGDAFGMVVADPAVLGEVGAETIAAWEQLGVLPLVEPGLERWLSARDACAVLVRPDRYVFGHAASPAEVSTLTAVLAERLQ